MRELNTIDEVRHSLEEVRRSSSSSVGFVPTMGALHEGHLSLIRKARAENDTVIVSIFINPLQFGPNEDLDKYPRSIESDRTAAESAGVDLLFVPTTEEMYPNGAINTTVSVGRITRYLEGALRPGHFDGVATVVSKLFSIVGPSHAYFGEKDWQQLAVIRQMVADLSIPVDVVGCPIVREADGLALSSRNVYLKEEARTAAARISRCLFDAQKMIADGEQSAAAITDFLVRSITTHNVVVNYVDAVGPTFDSVTEIADDTRLCVSVNVYGTNLIDNVAAVV